MPADGQQWVPASSHSLVANSSIKCSSLSQTLTTTQNLSLQQPEEEEIPLHPEKLFPLLQVYGWDLSKTVWKICGRDEKCTQSPHSPR